MSYELPTSVNVAGQEYAIRSDYRVALDIYAALNDAELEDDVRAYEVLACFYEDFEDMPPEDHEEAIQKCFWFLNGGKQEGKKGPKLIDWEQDFPLMVGPVNRVIGTEIRAVKYLHWWTFLSAYNEIGECFFNQVVRRRSMVLPG